MQLNAKKSQTTSKKNNKNKQLCKRELLRKKFATNIIKYMPKFMIGSILNLIRYFIFIFIYFVFNFLILFYLFLWPFYFIFISIYISFIYLFLYLFTAVWSYINTGANKDSPRHFFKTV
jgi:hypothetical protein